MVLPRKPTVLIADSDSQHASHLKDSFEFAGYKAVAVRDGLSTLNVLEALKPDVIVLDTVLPHLSGLDLLGRIREFSETPLVVVSRRAEESFKVKCLNLGADDYLTKPCGVEELLARVAAILRRSRRLDAERATDRLVCGDVSLDFGRRQVKVGEREIDLTPTEFKLLSQLMANPGRVMFHEELLSRVWGVSYRDEVEYLRVYVRYLREKIEENPSRPRHILSKPGIGYAFASLDGN